MKTKISLMAIALLVMFAFVAFSPVRPIAEVDAQNSNTKKEGDKEKRLKKAEKVELKSAKGTGQQDQNIIGSRARNTIADQTKGMTRGTGQRTCYIDLDNNTGYVIDIYVDGRYRGTMGAWDASYTTTGSGSTRVYARADFDDGSYLYWGPRTYNCGTNARDGYVNFIMSP